jgi:hypothetical protein
VATELALDAVLDGGATTFDKFFPEDETIIDAGNLMTPPLPEGFSTWPLGFVSGYKSVATELALEAT